MYANHLHIVKFYLLELELNPYLYLIKPLTVDEIELEKLMKEGAEHDKIKDYRRVKSRLERYNKVVSVIQACAHKNEEMLSFLLESPTLRHFWTKQDFSDILYFLSSST